MKSQFKSVLLVTSALFIGFGFYIVFLWLTYIDDTVTEGQKYGFTIGSLKHETYNNVIQLLEEYPELKIYISYGPQAGDTTSFQPSHANYGKVQAHNNWSLLLDGDGEFFNVIKLEHENEVLSEIYRHRKYFELP